MTLSIDERHSFLELLSQQLEREAKAVKQPPRH